MALIPSEYLRVGHLPRKGIASLRQSASGQLSDRLQLRPAAEMGPADRVPVRQQCRHHPDDLVQPLDLSDNRTGDQLERGFPAAPDGFPAGCPQPPDRDFLPVFREMAAKIACAIVGAGVDGVHPFQHPLPVGDEAAGCRIAVQVIPVAAGDRPYFPLKETLLQPHHHARRHLHPVAVQQLLPVFPGQLTKPRMAADQAEDLFRPAPVIESVCEFYRAAPRFLPEHLPPSCPGQHPARLAEDHSGLSDSRTVDIQPQHLSIRGNRAGLAHRQPGHRRDHQNPVKRLAGNPDLPFQIFFPGVKGVIICQQDQQPPIHPQNLRPKSSKPVSASGLR